MKVRLGRQALSAAVIEGSRLLMTNNNANDPNIIGLL